MVYGNFSLLCLETGFDTLTCSELAEYHWVLKESLGHAQRWMAAQKLILEGQNVQLVIQNMGMEKMNVSLYEKEN